MNRYIESTLSWIPYAMILVPFGAVALPFVPGAIRDGALLALALVAFLCVLAVASARGVNVRVPSVWLLCAIGFLCIIVATSSFRFGVSVFSLWGLGFEMGTVGSYLLFACAVYAGNFVVDRRQFFAVYIALTILGAAACAISTFLFSGSTSIAGVGGAWTQVSLLLACALAATLASADQQKIGGLSRMHMLASAILLVEFAFFFTIEAYAIAVVVYGGIYAARYFAQQQRNLFFPRYAAIAACALAVIAVTGFHPKAPADARTRPSLLSTEIIASSVFRASVGEALVGHGPRAFGDAWNTHRTPGFNVGPYWNVTPTTGYSSLATIGIELGALGLLAWLWIAWIWAQAAVSRLRESEIDSETIAMLSVGLFFFIALIAYPIGMGLFLLGALIIGMSTADPLQTSNPYEMPMRTTLGFVAILSGAMLGWIGIHQIMATHAHGIGIAGASTRDLTTLRPAYERAAALWGASEYAVDAAQANLLFAMTPQRQGGAPDEASAKAALESAKAYMTSKSMRGTQSFETYLRLAALSIDLARNGDFESLQRAENAIIIARSKAPSRLEPRLLEAALLEMRGNVKEAYLLVGELLKQKPDYIEARQFLQRLDNMTSVETSTVPAAESVQ